MLIDTIISKLTDEDNKSNSYYSFETFVLNLLKIHAKAQNKDIVTNLGRTANMDALAPEGFDDFVGPTAVEIKLSLMNQPLQMIAKYLAGHIMAKPDDIKIHYFLIISTTRFSDNKKKMLEDYIEALTASVEIHVWGPDELNKLVTKHQKEANRIIDNLFSLRLQSAVSQPIGDWIAKRKEIIERVKDLYRKGQFSLFLGAGVSSSAGMPDWTTLLNSLFVTYLTKEFVSDAAITDADISQIVLRLSKVNEPSALMAARYLRKGLSRNKGETKDFIEATTKNLYSLRNTSKNIESDLIKSIASLCMPKRTGAKVKSVVSYNFDDLLERQLGKSSIQYRSIYTDTESYDPDELPIHHVHGFLPQVKEEYDGLDNSTLVFSEEGYHQIYSDFYHWSNLVQLNNLRENNCLMVGLSMADPNLRRLLDISARNLENTKHFTFMKRMTEDDFCYDETNSESKQVISNKAAATKFLDRHHTLNEEIMKELGVSVIWYEKYEDIPTIIKSIRDV